MEVIKKGRRYLVNNDTIHEEEILITEVSSGVAKYSIVKTKLEDEIARYFQGSFGSFTFGSPFHSWLVDSERQAVKNKFRRDLEAVLREDLSGTSGRETSD